MEEFDYESIDPGYYDVAYHKRSGIQSKWHHIKFETIHSILETVEFEDMLDIACGPGTFLGTFQDRDKKFTGIDLAEKQIKYAKERYQTENKNFLVQDATLMEFPDESFDLVTSIEFIEHIEREVFLKILSECRRCLKKGGHILLTTPNYEFGWYFIEFLLSKISKVDYTAQHISKFNLEKLVNILEENGFEIEIARKYIYNAPFFAPFGWDAAQKIHAIEYKNPNRGYSLIALARKV